MLGQGPNFLVYHEVFVVTVNDDLRSLQAEFKKQLLLLLLIQAHWVALLTFLFSGVESAQVHHRLPPLASEDSKTSHIFREDENAEAISSIHRS